LYVNDGSAATPSITFHNDISLDTGLYLIGENNIGVAAAGVQQMSISSTATQISNDLRLSAGLRRSITTSSGTAVTLDSTMHIIRLTYAVDATAVVVTVPLASAHSGREYVIIKFGNGGGVVEINASGSDHFDNDVTTQLVLSSKGTRVTILSDGVATWYTV
jgi:hypothetical protein